MQCNFVSDYHVFYDFEFACICQILTEDSQQLQVEDSNLLVLVALNLEAAWCRYIDLQASSCLYSPDAFLSCRLSR